MKKKATSSSGGRKGDNALPDAPSAATKGCRDLLCGRLGSLLHGRQEEPLLARLAGHADECAFGAYNVSCTGSCGVKGAARHASDHFVGFGRNKESQGGYGPVSVLVDGVRKIVLVSSCVYKNASPTSPTSHCRQLSFCE